MHLSRVQSSFSQPSRSASRSRAQSGSGSSASSPRLQIRGRTLPQDDSLLPDLRLDILHRRSSNTRSSPALPDPQNHILTSFQIDPAPPPIDPSYYRHSLPDMPPRYAHNCVPQYSLTPHFTLTHVPGHTSPYIPPHSHSGQGTPPYPPYTTYPAYMYGQAPFFWGDIPPHSHNQFQNQHSIPSNHDHASEHAVQHKIEFGSISPAITTESGTSTHAAQLQNGSHPKPSKSVVFGTINPAESQDDPSASPPYEEQSTDAIVEHTTEQFATFSIGVSPDEPGPSRLGSRKSSVKSLFRTFSQPTTNDDAKGPDIASPSLREVNDINNPVKWEFGTTRSVDLDDRRPAPSLPTSVPPPSHQSEPTDDQPDLLNVPPSDDTPRADRSMDKSETGSTTSDVWVVKNYGYGFGDHSACGNAPDVVRREMRERERARARESHREREMPRDHRDRSLVPTRQPAWRRENGVEEGRENWEHQVQADDLRRVRPRRGSLSGYGGHDRGGFVPRRGRGFGGRFHGGRGRGGISHQRPASYPYVPPPAPPPPPPFEAFPHSIDTVNGYGPYAPPEAEPYEAVPPPLRPPVSFTPAAYSVDAMRNCLLGQLEYYLSPENMAQDFYLRQRVSLGPSPLFYLAIFPWCLLLIFVMFHCRWTARAGSQSHCWRRSSGYGSCTRIQILSGRCSGGRR